MRIKKIIRQHRRDFDALYECLHCGHEAEGYGYDDRNFHEIVVPNMRCSKCGKKANPETYRPLTTKYPEDQTV